MKQPLTMNVLTHIAGAAILAKIRITEVSDVITYGSSVCIATRA